MLTTYAFDLELTVPILGPRHLHFGDVNCQVEVSYSVDAGNLEWLIEEVRAWAYDTAKKREVGYYQPSKHDGTARTVTGEYTGAFWDLSRIVDRAIAEHQPTRDAIADAAWEHYRQRGDMDADRRREDRAERAA